MIYSKNYLLEDVTVAETYASLVFLLIAGECHLKSEVLHMVVVVKVNIGIPSHMDDNIMSLLLSFLHFDCVWGH